MVDKSRLRGKLAASDSDATTGAAGRQFGRVIDGLRLAHGQILVMRLSEGTDFIEKSLTEVDLFGLAWHVWQLCVPLKPELRAYREVKGGSKDDAETITGYDIVVSWPDEATRKELLGKRSDPHIGQICAAFEVGLQAVERRVQQTLSEAQGKCDQCAAQGWASVMELIPLQDFGYPANHPHQHGDPQLQPSMLGPAAAAVWAKLTADGDEPELQPRGSGMKTYYDIVLSWE